MIIRVASKREIWCSWVTAQGNSSWWELSALMPLFYQLINCHVRQLGRQQVIMKRTESNSRPKITIAISYPWRLSETNSFSSLSPICLNTAHAAQSHRVPSIGKLSHFILYSYFHRDEPSIEFLYENLCLNKFWQNAESGRK